MKSPEEIFKELNSFREGLDGNEARKRLEKYGLNKIEQEKKDTPFTILLSQFKSPFVYLLIITGLITLVIGKILDTIVIWGVIVLDVSVGFFQEYKASSAMTALAKTISLKSIVIRSKRKRLINVEHLVPGDIISIKAGDKIPADSRILNETNLEINEMILTGESMPVKKNAAAIKSEQAVADRKNMLYMGTTASAGNALAIVTTTGEGTELGKISKFIREEKHEKTFLQKEIARLVKIISIILVIITILIFTIGIYRGNELVQMFEESVAVAIGGLPEGLPISVTVIFAIGMQRIFKKKGLIRKLIATETLGRTEILCIDKTATLTKGKMDVIHLELAGRKLVIGEFNISESPEAVRLIGRIASVCNEAFLERKKGYQGGPTDIALLKLGMKLGYSKEKIEEETPILDFQPFDPNLKLTAALIKERKNNEIYVCGAPEEVLKQCSSIADNGNKIIGIRAITDQDYKKLYRKNEQLGAEGYRILAAAYKDVSSKFQKINKHYDSLTFLGLIVISDPLRKTAAETVLKAKNAGLRIIIITGDHINTAINIAKQVGIPCGKKNVITGGSLAKLSDDEFDKVVDKICLYARATPSDKVRIVNAWKKKEKIVAMTGDGVNDAPALAISDIGVALGSGTEVAKEASDLVLLDDDLKTILAAIEEGRGILDNIKKVVTYLLADSHSEILLVGFAILFGYPLPILPAQILWVNLVEDGLPDVALSLEKSEKDVMDIPPSSYKRPILDKEVITISFLIAWIDDAVLIGLFLYYYLTGADLSFIRTMVFAALTVDSLFFAFACKSLRRPIWRIRIFDNKLLNLSFFAGILTLIAAIYFPPFQLLLQTVPISLKHWGLLFIIGSIDLIAIEIVKEFFIWSNFWKKK